MEQRDTDQFGGHFLVDHSGVDIQDTGQRHGGIPVVLSPKQEKEMRALDQETKLMRAMNEIREMKAKNMTAGEREMFKRIAEEIFKKHGITTDYYRQYLSQLGTPQNLRRG